MSTSRTMPISTTAVVENHQATEWLGCVKNRKCNMVKSLQARKCRPLVSAENGTSLALDYHAISQATWQGRVGMSGICLTDLTRRPTEICAGVATVAIWRGDSLLWD